MEIPESNLRPKSSLEESLQYQVEFLTRQNEHLLAMIERLVKEATYFSNQPKRAAVELPVMVDEKTGKARRVTESEVLTQVSDLQELGIL